MYIRSCFNIKIINKNINIISLNTKWFKVLGTPIGDQGGVPMDPNPENALPEGIFWPNSVYIKNYSKTFILTKENWKIMFGLENRGETVSFMSRYFDETMTIFSVLV